MHHHIRYLSLCLLLGASGVAAAQSSSVTVYGVADAGLQFIDTKGGGSHSKLGVVSGGRNGSRLGLRGSEDLGDGLSAIFTLEGGYDMTNGMQGQGGRLWGRQAFVGLKSKELGTLAIGRIAPFSSGTGSFDMIGDIDPFLTSYGIAGVGSTLSSADSLRADNSVLYMSPTWGGWRFGAAYSFNADGEQSFDHRLNQTVTSLGLQYASGPLTAVLTFDSFHNPDGKDERHYQLGAAYDFEVVKLYAALGYESHQFAADFNVTGTSNGANARIWMVGASVPVGQAGTVRVSYQSRNGQRVGNDERDRSVASLGYEYNLSKRTILYAAVSSSDGRHTLEDDPDFNQRVYTVGMAHRF